MRAHPRRNPVPTPDEAQYRPQVHVLRPLAQAFLALGLAWGSAFVQAAAADGGVTDKVAPPAAVAAALQDAPSEVAQLAQWAIASADPAGLPFVIVDKRGSQVFAFAADGSMQGSSAALVGSARGDEAIPGIGNRPIAKIKPQERMTPAGRFKAFMGQGPEGEDILWVDYEQALALHRVVNHVAAEHRLERLRSPRAADRRITYGCINVPVRFFEDVVRPLFAASQGIVYILPETRPADTQFKVRMATQ